VGIRPNIFSWFKYQYLQSPSLCASVLVSCAFSTLTFLVAFVISSGVCCSCCPYSSWNSVRHRRRLGGVKRYLSFWNTRHPFRHSLGVCFTDSERTVKAPAQPWQEREMLRKLAFSAAHFVAAHNGLHNKRFTGSKTSIHGLFVLFSSQWRCTL